MDEQVGLPDPLNTPMFKTLMNLVYRDPDLPLRAWRLDALTRMLDGTIYDVLTIPFHDEYSGGQFVPIKKRRPSVTSKLCRSIVNDSVSLLFGEKRFPHLHVEDKQLRDQLAAMARETKLPSVMQDAATKGSVGSVAIRLRILSSRVFFDVMPTTFLTPMYDPNEPDKLLSITERRKVSGEALAAAGYAVDPDQTLWWFRVDYTRMGEDRFLPLSLDDASNKKPFRRDDARSVEHGLGFVPIVWVRNLVGGDDLDGLSTFEPAADAAVEISYLLSQAGRGLRYQSDPTLVIKSPAGLEDDQLVRSASSAVVVEKDGDAKLLELSGSSTTAVIDYCRTVREFALEAVRGNRASPEKLSAAQSGRALEVMSASLYSLVDDLRRSYGEDALVSLIQMVFRASHRYPIKIAGKLLKPVAPDTNVSLRWGRYHAEDAEDRQAEATRLDILTKQGLLSKETATASLSENFDIEDLPAELAKIAADDAKRLAEIPEAGRQLKLTE